MGIMKPSIFSIMSFAALLLSRPVMAQEPSCPMESTWEQASYAQRTTRMDGRTIKAKVEGYSNAATAELDVDGDRSAIISVRMNDGDDTIALTLGRNRPYPAEFGEIGMAVEPPMANGGWPRMKRPCDIKDGSAVEFTEKDMDARLPEDKPHTPLFHGILKRQGLNFSYSIAVEANGKEPAFSWEGKLKYGTADKAFDTATDVQGWHVYRANTFVRTIPVGKPVPLSAVLEEMGKSAR